MESHRIQTFCLVFRPSCFEEGLATGQVQALLAPTCCNCYPVMPLDGKFLPIRSPFVWTFVQQCKSIYGEQSLVYNVHCLIHLTEDCCRFGCLDSFSCFPFENYLKELKTFVRSGNRPLQQIYCRIIEQQSCPAVTGSPDSGVEFGVVPSSSHSSGPTLSYPKWQQYRRAVWKRSAITTKAPDNCLLLTDNRIVIVSNFLLSGTNILIVGKLCRNEGSFYANPCQSAGLSVFKVSTRHCILDTFSFSHIVCKGQLLPFKQKFVFFPLFHLL